MSRIGLILNEQKTSIRDARREEFNFLGYTFGTRYWVKNGQRYMAARPSKKSIQRLTAGVYDLLQRREKGPWPEVCDQLNAKLRGWRGYFSYGSLLKAYREIDAYVYDRVRYFMRRRHQSSDSRGTRSFSASVVFGRLGVLRFQNDGLGTTA